MKLVLLALAIVGSTTAFAQNLAQRKQLADWRKELTEKEKWLEKKCGTHIPAEMDGAWVSSGFLEAHTSGSGYCESLTSAVAGLCERDEISKEAIAKQIKKITCKPGKEKEQVFSFEGSTFVGRLGMNAPNITDNARKWLENNLK